MCASNPQCALRLTKSFCIILIQQSGEQLYTGIKLRERKTRIEDNLSLLTELRNDSDKDVKKMIPHVLR